MGQHIILYHIRNYHSYQIRYVMNNSEKILKTISSLIENGILTTKDLKKEISTDFRFKKDKLLNKLDLVTRAEFEVLKKIVRKLEKMLKELKINKKFKKAKKS